MLLENVMALSVVKPANRSSQPASSRPVSSARKTVSGFPADSNLDLGEEIVRDDPSSFVDPHRSESARGSASCLSSSVGLTGW
jgi:hypothetical protein